MYIGGASIFGGIVAGTQTTKRTVAVPLFLRSLPTYRPFRIALHFCRRYPLSFFSLRICIFVYICMCVCVCARVCVTFLRRVTHAFACLSLYFHFRRTLTRPLGFVFSFSLSFSLSHRIRTLLTSGPYLASFLPSFLAF